MSSNNRIFPTTLEGFGYSFNGDGQLRKVDPGTSQVGTQPFEFKVSTNADYNQKRYEALGEVVTKHVYSILENKVGLQKLIVPKNGNPSESTFVYATQDIYTNTERLLILINGNGVVRAGQWARSLIINDSIQSGTQIPDIERAQELGYAVLVLNINDNTRTVGGRDIKIKDSGSPQEHVDYVWKNYVKDINPRHIAIIAHSYGGCLALELANRNLPDFQNAVFAVALTDSIHEANRVPHQVMNYMHEVARNWVTNKSPLDTPVQASDDIPKVSSGSTRHEMTTRSSFDSIFKFIQERYYKVAGTSSTGNRNRPHGVRVIMEQRVEFQYVQF